jgi:D-serine dehydratase
MSGGRRMMEAPIDAWEKGAPALKQPLALSSVPEQDWRILREDFPLPIALIKQRALLHNSEWMKSFLGQGGVLIAPHGKTTMAPELFDLQLADGAWAITLSTPHQSGRRAPSATTGFSSLISLSVVQQSSQSWRS